MLIDLIQLQSKYGINLVDVLHLGANTGQEAETYERMGAERVIWVEALEPVFLKLKKHLARFPKQIALHACVSDKLGETVLFNIANNGSQSSSILELGTHATEHPTVRYTGTVRMQTVTVESLLVHASLSIRPGSFLNADLQGAELMALRGMENLMDRFDYVYLEVNDEELYKGCALTPEVDKWLADRGFVGREVHMTGSGWGDKFYMRV